MAVRKIKVVRKEVDKVPDVQSLAERTKEWLEKYANHMIGAMVGILVIAVVIWGVKSYGESRERRAASDYVKISMAWPGADVSDPKAYEKIVPDLEKFIKDHDGTNAAIGARMDLGKAFFVMKQYNDALTWAKKAQDALPESHMLKPLARYQVAQTYQAMGNVDAAMTEWNELKAKGGPIPAREVDWNLAKLCLAKKDYARALELMQSALKVSGEYPSSVLLQEEIASVKLKQETKGQTP